jgi:malate synthase
LTTTLEGVEVVAPADEEVLSADALTFVAELQRELGSRRHELLEARRERHAALARGERPEIVAHEGDWRVAEAPRDLRDRRVEITGPVDRKMVINALNSGTRVFMADFEDANSPTWSNVVEGQRNVRDAVRREISFNTGEKSYRLNDEIATLLVRPRG